jgi:spermidine synthase
VSADPRIPAGEPTPADDRDREPPRPAARRGTRFLLLISVFAVASAGLVYELVAGAVSSYLMGDAVTQFSLVIGVFLCAMGLGSWLAQFIRRNLIRAFVELEIWIGLIGGLSSLLMFAIDAFAEPLFPPLFYLLCAIIGVMVGAEIPLLVRIVKADTGVTQALSAVLALDYVGALIGAILFPLLALPLLGLSRASLVFGLMNLAVAAAGLTLLRERRRGPAVRVAVATLLLLAAFIGSTRMVGILEDILYQDSVILVRQTPYQRIVLTRWRDDVRLFLNGHLQFSAVDEARYHEALVHPAMAAAGRPTGVLVLGGGDGLAVREILKHPTVERVTVVDIDPVVTELARTRDELVALNEGALNDPRVTLVHTDAMRFLSTDETFYDVIIADLPDPSSAGLAKLYSGGFYALAARRLARSGALVTQATSPYFAREAFWSIERTIAGAVDGEELQPLVTHPYHVHVPSFGEWGFVLAAFGELAVDHFTVTVPTRFLDDRTLRDAFAFPLDLQPVEVEANTLDNPVLHRLYQRGWDRFNQ